MELHTSTRKEAKWDDSEFFSMFKSFKGIWLQRLLMGSRP